MPHNLHSIKGVEIMREGVWNGIPFKKSDIRQIVESFQATKTAILPFLKLGHNDAQDVLNRDDVPAAGWVSDLRTKQTDNGLTIIADFQGIGDKVFELIKRKAFRGRSIEIFPNVKVGGVTHRWLLTAVALLGAELPAVDSLDDMLALFSANELEAAFEGGAVHKFEAEGEPLVFKTEDLNTPPEEETMPKQLEEVLEKLGAADAKNEGLTKDLATEKGLKNDAIKSRDEFKKTTDEGATKIKTLEGELKKSKEEAGKFKAEKLSAEIDAELDKMVRDKKIVPAQKESFKVMLSALPVVDGEAAKFTLGDKKDLSLKDVLLAFVGAGSGVSLNDKEKGSAGADKIEGEDKGAVGVKLKAAAKKYQKDQKAEDNEVSYIEALTFVAAKNGTDVEEGDE